MVEVARIGEAIERREVERIEWIPTQLMQVCVLTKRGVNGAQLIEALDSAGCWKLLVSRSSIVRQALSHVVSRREERKETRSGLLNAFIIKIVLISDKALNYMSS